MYSETVLDPLGPIDAPFEVVDLNIDFDPDSVPRGQLPGEQAPTREVPLIAAPAAVIEPARVEAAASLPPPASVAEPPSGPLLEPEPAPAVHAGSASEAELDRSFANLSERDRELLLQSSLRALAPPERQAQDLENDRQLKAAAFVLRMKLMEDKLRGKGS
jgi:hypothetical protein